MSHRHGRPVVGALRDITPLGVGGTEREVYM